VAFGVLINEDVVPPESRDSLPTKSFRRRTFLAQVPGPYEGQPLEYRSLSVRICVCEAEPGQDHPALTHITAKAAGSPSEFREFGVSVAASGSHRRRPRRQAETVENPAGDGRILDGCQNAHPPGIGYSITPFPQFLDRLGWKTAFISPMLPSGCDYAPNRFNESRGSLPGVPGI
jgi:hypothetical protein